MSDIYVVVDPTLPRDAMGVVWQFPDGSEDRYSFHERDRRVAARVVALYTAGETAQARALAQRHARTSTLGVRGGVL